MTIEQKIAKLTEHADGKTTEEDAISQEEYDALSDAEKAEYETIGEDTGISYEKYADVTEDVKALTEGEELSEEFKAKAATIFEAAVISRVKNAVESIQEDYDTKLQEEVEEIKEGLIEKIDGYLDYIVEQWMEENELALEAGIKGEIQESFISGMKKLFEDHYIDLPDERFDVVEELNDELHETSSKLDEEFKNNVALKKEVINLQKQIAINESATGMVATDAEKFRELTKELVYESYEAFNGKLQTIKETYFGKKDTKTKVESVVSDTPILTEEAAETNVTGPMAAYLRTLNNMTSK